MTLDTPEVLRERLQALVPGSSLHSLAQLVYSAEVKGSSEAEINAVKLVMGGSDSSNED